MKKTMKPATLLMPLPAVLVSCGSLEKPNIITIDRHCQFHAADDLYFCAQIPLFS